jgi:outer membrane protein insertion porin family
MATLCPGYRPGSSVPVHEFIAIGLFLILCPVRTLSQMPTVASRLYEGQTVSAIDLVANPHRDVEPLRSLIVQKVGEPYSDQKVQTSVAALQETGKFPKVEAQVTPDPDGLRVSFVLEPAYRLGILDFSEFGRRFSYTRLLQVANLSDDEPYNRSHLPAAEKALLDFFHSNGYFQAEVHASPNIDDPHQLVHVTFAGRLGKQAKIANVQIDGPPGPESASLVRAVHSLRARLTGALLKSGKPYTPSRIKAATTLIKRTLARQNRLASTVRENPPQYRPETNRVDVSFAVTEGPVVSIRTTGAKLSSIPFLSGRKLKTLIPVFSEGTIDRDLVQEGQQNLVDYFQKKGYFDVSVKTNFERASDHISLLYQIDPGKKHKVRSISFRGNQQVSDQALLSQVAIKKSHLFSHGSISQKQVKESVDKLRALYLDIGYEDAKVTPKVEDHEPFLDVIFQIEEGRQTWVDAVHVTGNQSFPLSRLTNGKPLPLRASYPFSPRRMIEGRNEIAAAYQNSGYLNAEVKANVNRNPSDPHRVEVTYSIDEGHMVRVDDVLYLGQKQTRLSLLKKTTQIPPESVMSRRMLLAGETRLYDLNIFDWSSVGPKKPITDQTEEDVLVRVHEAKRNEITYGFGFEVSHRGGNTPSGSVAVPGLPTIGLGSQKIAPSQSTFASPRGSVEFTRRNMRGLAETFSTALLLSRLDQRALVTYAQAHFIGSQWNSLTSFSIERTTENPLFAAGLGDASFQVERLISRRSNTRLQIRYDFNKTSLSHLLVPELVLPQDRNIHLSTFSGTLIRDTRDKPLDAHRGNFGTLDLGITPGPLGSSATFAKLYGQYAFYKPVGSMVFANSVRLGLAKALASSFVPTSQLFFSGGGTSLRGFPINQAGPQRLVPFCNVLQGQPACVPVSIPVGGRQLFILNSELRFPLKLMKALGGVVFYDGGNVYRAINLNSFVNDYTNTVGFGFRYATPIGPIRFDIGRNLNPVPGVSATQYFITLGQAF